MGPVSVVVVDVVDDEAFELAAVPDEGCVEELEVPIGAGSSLGGCVFANERQYQLQNGFERRREFEGGVLQQRGRGPRVSDGMQIVDFLAVVKDECRGHGECCELLIGHSECRLLTERLEMFARSLHRREELRHVLSHQFRTALGAIAFGVRGPERCLADLLHRGEAVVIDVLQVVLLGELLRSERSARQGCDHKRRDVFGVTLRQDHVRSRTG